MVQGAGFRVQGSGFRVQGAGFKVQGSGFRVSVQLVEGLRRVSISGFVVSSLESSMHRGEVLAWLRARGPGIGVQGLRFRV